MEEECQENIKGSQKDMKESVSKNLKISKVCEGKNFVLNLYLGENPL